MSLQLFDKGVFAVASEATYNTDGIDSILQADEDLTFLSVNATPSIDAVDAMVESSQFRAAHDGIAHSMIRDHNTLSVAFPLAGPTAVGVSGGEAPAYAPILKACNLKEEIVDATSAIYTLNTANIDSLTAYMWIRNAENNNHRLNSITGARGSATFNWAIKEEATCSAEFLGASSNDWSDSLAYFDSDSQPLLDASGSALTYLGTASKDAAPIMKCVAMVVTFGGTTYPISSGSLDLGWSTVSARESVTAAQAVTKLINTRGSGARPQGSFSLADGGAAYDDILSKWRAATEAAFVVTLDDGTQKITFTMPKVQLGVPARSDAGGLAQFDLDFYLNGDYAGSAGGNNSLTIAYAESS